MSLGDVAAITSAAVAIIAAFAAFRSARAAESSAKSAAAIPRRALIRDAAATAAQIVDWMKATEAKVQQWKAHHNSYCAATGGYHSGGRIEVQGKIDAKLAEIAALRTEAEALNRDSPQLQAASDDDLSITLAKLVATLDKVHRIDNEATAALASLEAKSEAHRDRMHAELMGRSHGPRN